MPVSAEVCGWNYLLHQTHKKTCWKKLILPTLLPYNQADCDLIKITSRWSRWFQHQYCDLWARNLLLSWCFHCSTEQDRSNKIVPTWQQRRKLQKSIIKLLNTLNAALHWQTLFGLVKGPSGTAQHNNIQTERSQLQSQNLYMMYYKNMFQAV